MATEYKVVIYGQTISKKNSKQIVIDGNGKRRVISSKPYLDYEEYALYQLRDNPLIGKQWRYPLSVSFLFGRKDKRAFDYLNIAQGPLDLLIQAGIIKDDNMAHIVPCGFSWYVHKENPFCLMTIKESEE